MASLAQGLYELLVTQLLEEQLRHSQLQGTPDLDELRNAEAADRIALHVAKVVEMAIEDAPPDDRSVEGVKLARQLPDGRPQAIAKPLIPLLDTTLLTNALGEPRVGACGRYA